MVTRAHNQLMTAPRAIDRASLRVIVAKIEPYLPQLPDALRASFTELVGLLELGPASETRSCPRCKHVVMRAAPRCGYCWTKLPSLATNGARR